MQNDPANGGILMQDDKAFNPYNPYTAQPVMVNMPPQKLDDDIIFSAFNLQFCNPCCLGFAAYYNSVKARDRRYLGDFASARAYGSRARRLNIAAFIIGVIFLIMFIVIFVKTSSQSTAGYHH